MRAHLVVVPAPLVDADASVDAIPKPLQRQAYYNYISRHRMLLVIDYMARERNSASDSVTLLGRTRLM